MSTTPLTATYASPSESQTLSSDLPAAPHAGDMKGKTAYLSALRSNIAQMQSDVNGLLTRKMEEDKAGPGEGKKDDRDAKAEEMYGEEEAEEEG